jgi:Protein of unknown function (DUF3592)
MLVADILLEFLIRVVINLFHSIRSHSWPVISAKIEGTSVDRGVTSCYVAEVHYSYSINDETLDGYFNEPFWIRENGEGYVRQFSAESATPIRVNPSNPSQSFLVNG